MQLSKQLLYTLAFIAVASLLFAIATVIFNSNMLIYMISLLSVIVGYLFIINPVSLICFSVFVLLHESVVQYVVMGLTIKNIILAFCILTLIAHHVLYVRGKELEVYTDKKGWILLAGYLAALVVTTTMNSDIESMRKVIVYVLSVIIMTSLVYISRMHHKNIVNKIIRALILSGVVLAIIGFIEVAIGQTFYYSQWTLEDRYRFGILRMGSTVADPNFVCFSIVPLLPLVIYKFQCSCCKRVKVLYFLSITIMVMAVILTMSRIGLLALLVLIGVICAIPIITRAKDSVFCRRCMKLMLGVLLIGALYGAYVKLTIDKDTQSSSSVRIEALESSLGVFKRHPILGVGFEELSNANAIHMRSSISGVGGLSSMNTYVKILAENGAVTFLMVVLFVSYIFRKARVLSRTKLLFRYITLSLFLWLLIALTLDSTGNIVFWMLCAFVLVENKEDVSHNE